MVSRAAEEAVRPVCPAGGQVGRDPPLPPRFAGFHGEERDTARESRDLRPEARSGRLIGTDPPLSPDIAAPSPGGLRPPTAWCRGVDCHRPIAPAPRPRQRSAAPSESAPP